MLMTAAGAVLIWAVNVTSTNVNLHAVGWVLFALGLFGMALSLILWSTSGMSGRRRTVIDDRGRVTEERTQTY
jgi:hypothetical protein